MGLGPDPVEQQPPDGGPGAQLGHARRLALLERVEEALHVAGQRRVGGEEREVGVEPGVAGVVVAGPEVDELAPAALDPDGLGVHLARGQGQHPDPRVLEAEAPFQVLQLVEAGAGLEQHRHVLPGPRGLDERLGQHVVVAHPVEGGAHGGDLGVARRRPGEVLHRVVPLVRVEDHLIAQRDAGEGVLREAGDHPGPQRGELEGGRGVVHQRGDHAQVERGLHPEDLGRLEAERDADRLGPVRREVLLDLQVAGAAVEPGLERGREVLPVEAELVDGGEPDHPQLVQFQVAPFQEEVAAQPQELAEPDVGAVPPRDLQQAGQAVGEADQVLEHAEPGREVEGLGADLADRVGPQHVGAGGHLLGQEGPEVVELLPGQRGDRDHPDGVGLELVEQPPVGLAGGVGLAAGLPEELLVGRGSALLQERPGDAGGEELVEVGRPDAEEAEPLHQGEVGAPGLLEDPAVEAQPRQFLFDEHVLSPARGATSPHPG